MAYYHRPVFKDHASPVGIIAALARMSARAHVESELAKRRPQISKKQKKIVF